MIRRLLAVLAPILAATLAHATTTVCVTTPAELQSALSSAQSAADTTVIEVARGTYATAGTTFYLDSNSGQQLDISGGFNADCSAQIKNPALTVLDGGGTVPVMNMFSNAGVSIRYLTFQNGYYAGMSASTVGGLSLRTSGGIIVDYNIMRDNSSPFSPSMEVVVTQSSSTADLHVDGNLIVDNNAMTDFSGAVSNDGTGATYVTNNTIADNTAPTNAFGAFSIAGSPSTGTTSISNNIVWGNTRADLTIYSSPTLTNNDVGVVDGSTGAGSSGNVSVDPQFSSATDYHLLPTSPLLGQGTLTPAGNLPTIDIEGHPRSYNSLVDMGAYERGDEIFANNFDA